MWKRLSHDEDAQVSRALNNLALALSEQHKMVEAETLFREAMDINKRIYKGDHPDLALGLNNLAHILNLQEKVADAESSCRDAVAMWRRLYKGDNFEAAVSLTNLADLLHKQGKLTDAEVTCREALEMNIRLSKGKDNLQLARSMHATAGVCAARGRHTEAESLCRDALEMNIRLFGKNHPNVAGSMLSLSQLLRERGKLAEAEVLSRGSLDIYRRLFPGDHPDVADVLTELALVLSRARRALEEAEALSRTALAMDRRRYRGISRRLYVRLMTLANILITREKFTEAEAVAREALDMTKRLLPGDRPEVVVIEISLAGVLQRLGKLADAESLIRDSLATAKQLYNEDHQQIAGLENNLAYVLFAQGKFASALEHYLVALPAYRTLINKYADSLQEGDALTLLAGLPPTVDLFLSAAAAQRSPPASVYSEIWAFKAMITRQYERRAWSTRATTDPRAIPIVEALNDTRRRRAEVLMAPMPKDAATRRKRDDDLAGYARTIDRLNRDIRPFVSVEDWPGEKVETTPVELQKALPIGAAFVDFLAYVKVEQDLELPGKEGQKVTPSYVAFIVTKDKVNWIDCGPAKSIDKAIQEWRSAILSGREVRSDIATRVRELVWEKVQRILPTGTKTVYCSVETPVKVVASNRA
jgi:tetratricopeptide (TPR) repeat protein